MLITFFGQTFISAVDAKRERRWDQERHTQSGLE